MADKKTFERMFRTCLASRGWSLSKFAKICGVSLTTIIVVLKGNSTSKRIEAAMETLVAEESPKIIALLQKTAA